MVKVDPMGRSAQREHVHAVMRLAVGGRKLVGTAQAWKRVGGASMALAHAVVVVDTDPRSRTLAVLAEQFARAVMKQGLDAKAGRPR